MLAVLLILLNNLRTSRVVSFGQNELGLIFSQVHGLRAGDVVTIGGAPSGKVVDIDFASQAVQESLLPVTGGVTIVRVLVAFDSSRKIPRESTYSVQTDLYGRRWIEIKVSPSKEEIGDHEIFFAEESAIQDDQLQATLTAVTTLTAQTEELRDILADPDFRLRTKDAASNLRFYSRELMAASGKAPELLKSLEKTLDRQDAAMTAQLRSFDDKTKDVRQRMTEMSPQISENLKGWTERMERQGDRLKTTLQMAIERSQEYEDLIDRAMAQGLDPKAVDALIVQTKKWARKLQEYRYLAEDLHALTSDPTVRADLKDAIAKFKVKSEEINERLERLEKLIDSNPLPGILGIPKPKPTPAAVGAEKGSQAEDSPKLESPPEGGSEPEKPTTDKPAR